MIWIDYAIIIIISISCLISLSRGFFYEILSLITWICAFLISGHYYFYLSSWFVSFKDKLLQNGMAVITMFIISLITGSIISYIISQLKLTRKNNSLLEAEKIWVICIGAIRGILIVLFVLFFLEMFIGLSKNEDWQKSQLIQLFSSFILWFFDYLKNSSIFLFNL